MPVSCALTLEETEMPATRFEERLEKLVSQARRSETIPLHELIGVVGTVLAGLEMAHDEGEEW